MLFSINTGKYVTRLPHKKDFDRWMKNLSDTDYQKIIKELNRKIDLSDINTSSWIPGRDWTGTVYEPLYYSCNKSITASGFFFGLILFDLLMKRDDAVWGFGRFEKDGVPIHGTTYFLLKNPPPT